MLGWQVALDTVLWTTAALCTWKGRTARTTLEWCLAISPTGSSTSPCGDEKTSTTQTRTSTRASKDFSWRWHWVTFLACLPFVRCCSLSFVVVRCRSLLVVVGRCWSLMFVLVRWLLAVYSWLFAWYSFFNARCLFAVFCSRSLLLLLPFLLLVIWWLFAWYSLLMPVVCSLLLFVRCSLFAVHGFLIWYCCSLATFRLFVCCSFGYFTVAPTMLLIFKWTLVVSSHQLINYNGGPGPALAQALWHSGHSLNKVRCMRRPQ